MTADNDDAVGPIRTRFSDDESPSEAVVRALATVEDVDPATLDPLFRYLDPDALDALFEEPIIGDVGLVVTVTVDEYRVVVHEQGTVTVERHHADGDSEAV